VLFRSRPPFREPSQVVGHDPAHGDDGEPQHQRQAAGKPCLPRGPGGTAKGKLRAGRLLDACISLYDSRFRLPRHLAALSSIGPFPVNLSPLCLDFPDIVSPDVDAVYIASKVEVAHWAETRGYSVRFPAGKEGVFKYNAFLSITKRGTF